MADNVVVTAGTGTTIAADEVVDGTLGTVKVQYVKIMDGALDGTGKLSVYTEDAAAASDPTGNMLIARRKDTLSTTEVSADGDNIALNATNKGKLHVAAELRIGDAVIDTGVGTGGSATPRVVIDTASQNANGQATMANSAPVVIASDDPVAVSLALIDDAIKADDAAFTPATTKVMMAGFQADEASTDSVDEGDAGAVRMTLDRKLIATIQPHTNGGLSVFRSLDLDETEEDVKTSAGCLYKLRLTNRTTSARYVKLYNATAANVTVGTTTPIDTIVVPGGTSADLCTVVTESFGGVGLTFDTALSLAATTGLADNDTGAPGANDVVATAYYK
ncbi:hypothetical protein [Bradyrhizobium sp. SZCCHNRI1073]|uniref:hypothetical protein n=1 Tax=Bradyrhizobium sp. SZCCHNRI1073 TaxID=3057280 RepID=UPI0029161111|nr:hypothetical protein [Bradyrhizobium sp. SZCCHNRI1073]